MKYVHIDPVSGTVTWDRYFEYLRQMRHAFPADLYEYAVKWEHYSLESANSLHDSWLTSARFDSIRREVVLEFLGSYHDRTHMLRYSAVKSYSFNLQVEYVHGDQDVLAHEFRIEDNVIAHEILFRTGRQIVVMAASVIPGVRKAIEPIAGP